MEYIFDEIIPTYWKQGYFSFGTQKRIATVTDVKFISDNKLIVAHRAAAKLYLVQINNNTYEIIDSIVLQINNSYFHPDSITIQNNRIYMTAYTNLSCIVDIIDNKLNIVKIIKIHEYVNYHGCFVTNNLIYFGGVKDKDNNSPLTIYNYDTNQSVNIKLNYDRRIKTINIINNNILLCLDGKNSDITLFDSWIMYFKLQNNKLLLLDSIHIKNSQIDGSVIYNNHFFAVLHSEIYKCGYIYIGSINDTNITFIKKVQCNDFPHGIDIYNNKLAYTSYTNSSVMVHSLDEFIKID